MADFYKTRDLATGEDKLREFNTSSAGAGDAGKGVALDSAGKLDVSLLPSGIGAETVTAPSSENLAAGEYVNRWLDGSTLKVRLADADNGRPADGYVKAAVTSPANATVYPLGTINTDHSGLTVDAMYFLSATPGDVTDDISAFGDGDIIQRIGRAISTTAILTEWNEPEVIETA